MESGTEVMDSSSSDTVVMLRPCPPSTEVCHVSLPLFARLAIVVPVVLILSLIIAQSTLEPALVAAKKSKNKSKTITRTFTNADQISIPIFGEADPFPSTIQVGGFKKGKIKDVNVVLRSLEHTAPDDVDVLLVAPEGKSAFLMSDVGTNAEIGGVTLTLDDEAAASLPDSGRLLSGAFRPTNGSADFPGDGSRDFFPPPAPPPGDSELSAFDGTNPNGQWRLFVFDDFSPRAGFFADGWSLEITARIKKK